MATPQDKFEEYVRSYDTELSNVIHRIHLSNPNAPFHLVVKDFLIGKLAELKYKIVDEVAEQAGRLLNGLVEEMDKKKAEVGELKDEVAMLKRKVKSLEDEILS